jgi:hypothetical protein
MQPRSHSKRFQSRRGFTGHSDKESEDTFATGIKTEPRLKADPEINVEPGIKVEPGDGESADIWPDYDLRPNGE